MVAIPFRVGWGFQPSANLVLRARVIFLSQSLSGWDGVFDRMRIDIMERWIEGSQSLSGWDGVFNKALEDSRRGGLDLSQSLSGWDGVFDGRTFLSFR